MAVVVIPTNNTRDCNSQISRYLTHTDCRVLGLGYPSTAGRFLVPYVTGRMSYSKLVDLMEQVCDRDHHAFFYDQMIQQEWPLFSAAQTVCLTNPQSFIFPFENPELYLESQGVDDAFFAEMRLESPDIEKIIKIYEKWISVNGRRGKLNSRRINEQSKQFSFNSHAVASLIQAPLIVEELRGIDQQSQICHLEDFRIIPRDEMTLRKLLGQSISEKMTREYAEKDIAFHRYRYRSLVKNPDGNNSNRIEDSETQNPFEKYKLKTFMEIVEEL